MQEESLWQVDFDNLYLLHTINKKHVYKERKETTHVEVGERNIHPHIKKNEYNVCVKTITRPNVQEQCI